MLENARDLDTSQFLMEFDTAIWVGLSRPSMKAKVRLDNVRRYHFIPGITYQVVATVLIARFIQDFSDRRLVKRTGLTSERENYCLFGDIVSLFHLPTGSMRLLYEPQLVVLSGTTSLSNNLTKVFTFDADEQITNFVDWDYAAKAHQTKIAVRAAIDVKRFKGDPTVPPEGSHVIVRGTFDDYLLDANNHLSLITIIAVSFDIHSCDSVEEDDWWDGQRSDDIVDTHPLDRPPRPSPSSSTVVLSSSSSNPVESTGDGSSPPKPSKRTRTE